MLLSFRFANHRSFRDEQQLNLMPIYDSEERAQSDWPAVSVAGIFGANASGKSNLIDAFAYMRLLVGRSDRDVEPGYGLERRSFRLDPKVATYPSSYAVDLRLDGIRYTYGFTVDNAGIAEEWLYSYPRNRSRTIFERQRGDFSWGEDTRRTQLTRLADIVAPTALFLSVVARFGKFDGSSAGDRSQPDLSPLHSVYSWIWQRQVIDRPSVSGALPIRRLNQIATRWSSDDRARAIVVDLLRCADFGLLDVTVTPPQQQQLSLFPEPTTEDDIPKVMPVSRREREPQLRFKHRGASQDVFFEMADESSGTIRLLQSAVRAVPVLESGGVVLIDEIDASLHPLLTANLIALFQSRQANPRGAQLIFTSHDATLLGLLNGEEVLRRDQVWFTQKDDDGASDLFPLSDFRPRKEGENRMRRYLSGTYGAIPEMSMDLFEEALRSRSDDNA